MGIEEHARRLIEDALADLVRGGVLPPAVIGAAFVVERPKRAEHGDVATNAPLALQKLAQKAPRAVAELLAELLRRSDGVREVTIAGAGFLNLRFTPAPFHAVLRDVLAAGAGYGSGGGDGGARAPRVRQRQPDRAAPDLARARRVLGDAVGTLLEAMGHRVTREYYVNDFRQPGAAAGRVGASRDRGAAHARGRLRGRLREGARRVAGRERQGRPWRTPIRRRWRGRR